MIVLPVKSLAEAKTRLEPVLDPLERGSLTLAMLEDVMDATLALSGWETWVISPDEVVIEIALQRGVHAIVEDKPPLANAVRQVEEEAAARGVEHAGGAPRGYPPGHGSRAHRALHTLGPVVLAPSVDESGTNLLVRRPPTAIDARFGVDSYRRHLEAAAEAQIPTAVVEIPEIAFDLDLPSDILTVLEAGKRGRTLDVMVEMDLASRMPTRT